MSPHHPLDGYSLWMVVLSLRGVLTEVRWVCRYGVQHGSEIVLKTRSGQVVQTRQGKKAAARRNLQAQKGKQSI